MPNITATEVETFLKIAALLSAGIFFLWKAFTGWLIINLKLSLKLERAAMDTTKDHLAITILLEKGTTDSVWLQDVTARVVSSAANEPTTQLSFSEELRWLFVAKNKADRSTRVVWGQYVTPKRDIALSPSESMTLARMTQVPSGEPVFVEVAVYGRRNFWPRGFQWRASSVALPLPAK